MHASWPRFLAWNPCCDCCSCCPPARQPQQRGCCCARWCCCLQPRCCSPVAAVALCTVFPSSCWAEAAAGLLPSKHKRAAPRLVCKSRIQSEPCHICSGSVSCISLQMLGVGRNGPSFQAHMLPGPGRSAESERNKHFFTSLQALSSGSFRLPGSGRSWAESEYI